MTQTARNPLRDGTPEDKNVTARHIDYLPDLGYESVLHRRRSTLTLLFQSLAIAATPFGIGAPLLNAIYGGGPLSLFVGWLMVICLAECVAVSISELASRFPTSAGPYYWSFQIASKSKTLVSFLTGWTWLIGNWTIALSVNFGFASLIAGTVTMYKPDWKAAPWQLVLILYAILLVTLLACTFLNHLLPTIDTICAGWTALTLIVILVALLVQAKEGRHDAKYAFGHYDTSFSGWESFTFCIGLLPSAYTLAAVGMISSMAEETSEPARKVPRAISLSVPCLGLSGLLFIIPVCFTLPPMGRLIEAPYGQVLPVIFRSVMGSDAGSMGLLALVLVLTMCCSLSITTAASRCTWAFARDEAIPLSSLWYRVESKQGTPIPALALVTLVQALLGLINLGSSSAFTAFVSVGVMALTVSYLIPITISLIHKRREVNAAKFTCGPILGTLVNCVAVAWISFQLVLFSMPMVLPTDKSSMNYASVVLVGFVAFAFLWYAIHARKVYKGPPESDGIGA